MPVALGIDLGTQGVKALVCDADSGAVLSRGSAHLELSSPRPGAAEQHPAKWREAVGVAVRSALDARAGLRDAVVGIGVSGQQHGCVALDSAWQPVWPAKLWCDTEAADEASELTRLLGRRVPSGFTAPKLLWLRRHHPEAYARIRHVLLPHDWLNWELTGDAFTDAGDASGTGYFNVERRRYDERALAEIGSGLAAWVPPVVSPDAAAGALSNGAAEWLGLRPGIAVAAGSGDNMMGAIGAGAVEPGTMVLSLGTSGTIAAVSARPIIDPHGLVAAFCDATGVWMPLLCTMSCTAATQEVSAAFGMGHDELSARAATEPIGCHGLTFLPYLLGERVPDWPHATGVLHGIRPGLLRPGCAYRAAMEGATLALWQGYRRMRDMGLEARSLRVVGGASRSALWRQVIADIFGMPLQFPVEADSAALGAALAGAAAAAGRPLREFVRERPPAVEPGACVPDARAHADYQPVAARFDSIGASTFGSMA